MRSATKKRTGKDPAYLAWLHEQPCVLCAYRYPGPGPTLSVQLSRTEAAHVGVRGLSQKSSDRDAIPLCGIEHHREGKYSIHKLGKDFWKFHGIDRDALIAELNAEYQAAQESRPESSKPIRRT